MEFDHCGFTDPRGIVKNAIRRSAKYDQVICLIDRDTHDLNNFNDALQLEQGNAKVMAYVSYPCFEFWLLMHFGFNRKPFAAVGARSPGDRAVEVLRSKEGMANYAKGSIKGVFALLLPRLPDAMFHAEKTLIAAHEEGDMDPSTPLHKLIVLLDQLGKPIPL